MYRKIANGQALAVSPRAKIQRLMHGAALTLERGSCPEDWRYDLRRGRLQIYGGLLRYIDAALAQGQSPDDLQQIPQWIAAYITESADTPPTVLTLVA
jgi:hypothetical protein